MSGTLELREKRSKAWDEAKAYFQSNLTADGKLSKECLAAYDKMVADVEDMSQDIDRLERMDVIDRNLTAVYNTPLTARQQPTTGPIGDSRPLTGRASNEYNKAFWARLRKDEHSPEIRNALSVGSDSEGGYLVPDEFERTLISALADFNIMRALATRIITSYGTLQIPVVATRGTASWVEEAALIPDSDGSFDQVSLHPHKMATLIKVSHELISDSAFPLETFIAKDFGRRLGALEEEAFISGDGEKKPMGVLNDALVGHTSANPTEITFDDVIKLYYSLRTPYRSRASFIANEQTIMTLRTLQDDNGQYLWQPALTHETPQTILGRPLYSSVFMPTMEAGAKTLMFGDFAYYWIADRQGIILDRLSELFALSDQIGFKATQRVDGRLVLPEAVKVMQMSS